MLVRSTAALVLSFFVLGFSQLAAAQSVPDQGPGGPILVINSPSSSYGTFYAEVLRNEGFNEFAVENIQIEVSYREVPIVVLLRYVLQRNGNHCGCLGKTMKVGDFSADVWLCNRFRLRIRFKKTILFHGSMKCHAS